MKGQGGGAALNYKTSPSGSFEYAGGAVTYFGNISWWGTIDRVCEFPRLCVRLIELLFGDGKPGVR